MKNEYVTVKEKELVPLYEIEIPKIPEVLKAEHVALYDIVNSVGKNIKDFYNGTNIHMENNSIIGLFANKIGLKEIPKSIGKLENLTRLDLNENKISSIPSELWTLTSLKELGLYKNNLSSLSPNIGNLENLKELYLYWNNLESLPFELWKLENLETLGLRGNPIRSLSPEIRDMKNLKTVFLYDCPLDKDSQKLVKKLSQKGINAYWRAPSLE